MTRATLILNPAYPPCWEAAGTLRFGFDRALVRLHEVNADTERFLGALRAGVREDRLEAEASVAGLDLARATDLVVKLEPVLRRVAEPAHEQSAHSAPSELERRPPHQRRRSGPIHAVICDGGRAVAGFQQLLEIAGVHVADPPPEKPTLVIYVERFLEPLERAQRWLLAGVPHVPVRFSDTTISIGPVIESQGAPCHSCLSLAVLSSDPAYPALAAQMIGATPASETPELVALTAVFASRVITQWRPSAALSVAGMPSASAEQIVLPTRNGTLSGTPYRVLCAPHPECACSISGDAPPRSAAREPRLRDESGGRALRSRAA